MFEKIKHYFGYNHSHTHLAHTIDTMGNFHVLPNEILFVIFSFLSFRDFPSLFLVCKNIKLIAENYEIHHSIRAFQSKNVKLEIKGTYKELLTVLTKAKEIYNKEKFAYADEVARKAAREVYVMRTSKVSYVSLGLTFLICCSTHLLRKLEIFSNDYPSEGTLCWVLLGNFLIPQICSEFYLQYHTWNMNSKNDLADEFNKLLKNYKISEEKAHDKSISYSGHEQDIRHINFNS